MNRGRKPLVRKVEGNTVHVPYMDGEVTVNMKTEDEAKFVAGLKHLSYHIGTNNVQAVCPYTGRTTTLKPILARYRSKKKTPKTKSFTF